VHLKTSLWLGAHGVYCLDQYIQYVPRMYVTSSGEGNACLTQAACCVRLLLMHVLDQCQGQHLPLLLYTYTSQALVES
jgi:hypothetical protein